MVDRPQHYLPPKSVEGPFVKRRPLKRFVCLIALGIVVQVATYGLAVFSLGFGHGSDAIADVLFPYTALVDGMFTERSLMLSLMDLCLYVVYALLVAEAMFRKIGKPALVAILALHVSAVIVNWIR